MINFNFGALLKPIVNVAGTLTQANPSQSLPVVVAGTGVVAYIRQVPVTGFDLTIPDRTTTLVLNPAATLATGTVRMPAIPLDGQVCYVLSSQQITALSVQPNSGQSINAAPSTLAANGAAAWMYVATGLKWYRII